MTKPSRVEDLHDDVLVKVLTLVGDARDLVRATCVCKAWRQAVSLVPFVSLVIDDVAASYEGKVSEIASRLRSFRKLRKAHVVLGRPKADGDETLRRCMRYAEVGLAVDKFLFLAAKTGDCNLFFHQEVSPHSPPERAQSLGLADVLLVAGDAFGSPTLPLGSQAQAGGGSLSGSFLRPGRCAANAYDGGSRTLHRKLPVPLPLKHVMGPTDHSLRLMMPVIVFAIIRGFDDLLQVLPPLARQISSLDSLLIVDLTDNVTLNVRSHHMQQLRSLPAKFAATGKPLIQQIGSCTAQPGLLPELPADGQVPLARAPGESESQPAQPSSSTTPLPDFAVEPSGIDGGLGNSIGVLSLNFQPNAEPSAGETNAGEPSAVASLNAGHDTSTGDELIPPEDGQPLGVRERRRAQALEISRSSELDISFWRADEATVGPWSVKEISVCIASHGALPLSTEEMDALSTTAFGGLILEATMNFVNEKRGVKVL